LILGLGLLAALVLHAVQGGQSLTGWRFVYPLDDTYIHMAMAKNASGHGVWGVTRYQFTSASSSPLWTMLLAEIDAVTGPNLYVPLILTSLFAVAVVSTVYIIAFRSRWPAYWTALVLVALVAWTPLPALVFSGMEHVLQLWLSLLFLYTPVHVLSRPAQPFRWWSAETGLVLLAAALTLTRYEDLFLVFTFCVVALVYRRWRLSLAVGLMAWVPVLGYGLFSVWNDSFLLPNRVLRKGTAPGLQSVEQLRALFGLNGFMQLSGNGHFLVLVVAVLGLYLVRVVSQRTDAEEAGVATAIVIPSLWLHLNFAGTGWYFRYEAYLVGMALLTIGLLAAPFLPERQTLASARPRFALVAPGVLLLGIVLYPNLARGIGAVQISPYASKNIYEQQVQMADFIQEYYAGDCVALNDIGAVSFFRTPALWTFGAWHRMKCSARSETVPTRREKSTGCVPGTTPRLRWSTSAGTSGSAVCLPAGAR
jgi:hypothetical protein